MTQHDSQIQRSKKPQLMRKRTFALFISCIVIFGYLNSIRFGLANIQYYEVRNALELWQNKGEVQSKQVFGNVKQASITALDLHSANPLYNELAGQIIEWEVLSGYSQLNALQEAKAHYVQASKYRPLWPITYANLAMIKWRLQEFDEEMLEYVQKADRLGSQNVEVHVFIVRLGISLYQANHPMYIQIKNSLVRRISAGMRNQRSKPLILEYIEQNNAQESVCRWMVKIDIKMAKNELRCN